MRKINDILSAEEKKEMEKMLERSKEYRIPLKGNIGNMTDKQINEMCDFVENYEVLCIVVQSIIKQEDELYDKKAIAAAKYRAAKTNAERDKALKEFTKLKKALDDINLEYEYYEGNRKKIEEQALEYDRILLETRERLENKSKTQTSDENTASKPKEKSKPKTR